MRSFLQSTTVFVVLGLAACGPRSRAALPESPVAGFRITDAFSIAPRARFDALGPYRFGGVSGLAYDAAHGELLGICDDRDRSRFFRLRILERPFRVEPIAVVPLERAAGAPPALDAEGIALLPGGDIIIASEGIGNAQPRLPPALVRYTHEGRFVRQLPVRPRFAPNATGALDRGVRDNEAFESLTVSEDAARLFTATETTLVQDGDRASFDAPGMSRILEYVRKAETYVPAREFAYAVDPIPRPSFRAGYAISGLTDLLSIGGDRLIAMERAFVQHADSREGLTRIRLYLVDLDGATEVSAVESLKRRTDIHIARKTLIADLGAAPGLPPELHSLDNFEGLARLPSRQRRLGLLLVSDDNFSLAQRTWFVRAALPVARSAALQ